MTADEAQAFAAEWIAAWNSCDLARILSHYAEDIVFRSPTAARIVGTGTIIGKDALAAYWSKGLAMLPDLHFTLEAVLTGHDALTILYRNERGIQVAESVVFGDAGKVVESMACHG